MPRYYIDTDDGALLVHDDVGHVLPNPEAARDMAQRTLPDMAQQKMPDGERRTFTASVRDETGTVIYTVTLSLVGEWKVSQQAI